MRRIKKIAITMGDPAGIGPEVIVKALSHSKVRNICVPIVIGDENVFRNACALSPMTQKLKLIDSPDNVQPSDKLIYLLDMKTGSAFLRHRPSRRGGASAVRCIEKAVELAVQGNVQGVVTAPVSKESLRMAGVAWPGHTEMLADLTGTKEFAMMFIGGPLRIMLVTIHTALRNVPLMISQKRILRTIQLAQKASHMLGIKNPRIAVAGLNPHAGEAGMFGNEEKKIIAPAIRKAVKNGIPVTGPHPPDTVFHRAFHNDIDIIICMYHDQGLIPLKMIAFDKGVNITVGLPFIRTSPDHGTAYDIAWKGVANPSSMIEAITLAASLAV